ncbi:MAG TPA: amidohydrolase family protein [Longilinea sp.]|nr:amidohydrolase family protein [Longilinea sp.]
MPGILILPEWLIANTDEPPRRETGVRVVGDLITDVAANAELIRSFPDDEHWEASGQVLSPGFVNTHTHLYGVLSHGIPLSKAPDGFWPFLKDFWWPMVEDGIDHEMLRAAVEWQCQLMIHSGISSFYDCLEAPHSLPGNLEVESEIVKKYGLRAILSFEATQRVSQENGELGLRENAQFIDRCHQRDGLISGMMCYHTTFTCSADFIRRAFELSGARDTLVHAHCSEGTYEPEQALKNFGMRPIAYYDHLGVLSPNMLLSQCVQIDADEADLLARRGAHVSHMPLSNCEVGAGIAPIPQLAAAGVTLGLGSDSYIDNFFEVMRGAFLIHKANQCDPRKMPARLVWHMATEGGARALDLKNVGRIQAGWQADLQLIEADVPTPAGDWNLFDQLILYRNPEHVRMVMAAGKPLLKNGRLTFGDEQQARQAVSAQAARLWKKAM